MAQMCDGGINSSSPKVTVAVSNMLVNQHFQLAQFNLPTDDMAWIAPVDNGSRACTCKLASW